MMQTLGIGLPKIGRRQADIMNDDAADDACGVTGPSIEVR